MEGHKNLLLTCLPFGLPVSTACLLSVSQTSMDDSGHKGNTGQLLNSVCAVSNDLIYDSSLSLSVSVKVEPPTKFKKREGLTGPQLLEGVTFFRGGGGCSFHIIN